MNLREAKKKFSERFGDWVINCVDRVAGALNLKVNVQLLEYLTQRIEASFGNLISTPDASPDFETWLLGEITQYKREHSRFH